MNKINDLKVGVHGSAHVHESKYFFAFARYDIVQTYLMIMIAKECYLRVSCWSEKIKKAASGIKISILCANLYVKCIYTIKAN